MNSLVVLLAILGAISARTIPQTNFKVRGFPTGIVNGVNASISDFNFLGSVRVTTEDWSLVSGSAIILSDKWVLTAATSVFNQSVESLQVRVGSSSGVNGGQVVNVSKAIIHPRYLEPKNNNSIVLENNLALLKLKEDLKFNENVDAVTLSGLLPEVNSSAVVAGFGQTLNISDPTHLRSINVTIVDVVESRLSAANRTNLIRTKSNSNGGPTVLDWGSPLIVDGTVVGSFSSNNLPFERNSSTIDSFVDLTSVQFWDWLLDTSENN